MFSQDSGLEAHTLDIFKGWGLPRFAACRWLFLQILPRCVVPIQLPYCSRSSGSLLILNRKYQTCLIFMIRHHEASDSKSRSSQWESPDQEALATGFYVLYTNVAAKTNKIIPQAQRNTTKEDQKHNTRRDSQLMTLIILNSVFLVESHLITRVSNEIPCVCRIATVESLRQVCGLVLWRNCLACAWGGSYRVKN